MNTRKTLYVMSTALVAGGLIAGSLCPAVAQPETTQSAQQPPEGDPPALVGRLAFMQGTVSFHTAGQTQWQPATLNYPVTNGVAFWTEPRSLAGIEVGSSRIWMNAATELDVTALDDQTMVAVEPQGELYVHLDHLSSGESYTIETPRGEVTLTKNGVYDVVAGDTEHLTAVTVVGGAARVSANKLFMLVGPNQTATISGTDTFHGNVGVLAQDAFLADMEVREQQQLGATQPTQGSPPSIVSQMTGGLELQRYGSWQSDPQYGEVWYPPQAGSDWTPYQDGSWDYVAPWGWTWMSSEPWGFAPFHYGRWADLDGRWCWVPGGHGRGGRFERPVYAPALVAFFGLGAETERRQVGWVPLGPGEVYYPPYRVGDRYLRAINQFETRNELELRQDRRADEIAIDRFVNRRAAVMVPAAVMAESRPLRGASQPLTPERLAELQPVTGRDPLEPTLATAGVTPRVVRELRLQGELRPRGPEAPGPRIEAMALGRSGGPGERHALPPLREANVPLGAPLPAERLEMERRKPETAGGPEWDPPEIGPDVLPSLRPPSARPWGHGEFVHQGSREVRPGVPVITLGPRGPEVTPREPGAPLIALPGLQRPAGPGGLRENAMLPGDGRWREPNIIHLGEPHEGERAPGGVPPKVIVLRGLPGPASVPPRHEAMAEPLLQAPRQPATPQAFQPMPAPNISAPVVPLPMVQSPRFAPPPVMRFAPPVMRFAPPMMRLAPAMRVVAAPPHGGPPLRGDGRH